MCSRRRVNASASLEVFDSPILMTNSCMLSTLQSSVRKLELIMKTRWPRSFHWNMKIIWHYACLDLNWSAQIWLIYRHNNSFYFSHVHRTVKNSKQINNFFLFSFYPREYWMTLLARLSSQHFFRSVKRLLFFPGEGWLVENVYEKKNKSILSSLRGGVKVSFCMFFTGMGWNTLCCSCRFYIGMK